MIKEVEEERDTLKHKLKEIGDKITAMKQKLTKQERDCTKAKFNRLVITVLCVLAAKILFGIV
ncbi:hypothetical protein RND71_033101 [Anisodus tanguticus]|uniref:Uncharacterized protein n=1 Tax=Anisodus tanguticus TaxID=243964 RepID=A0AAE1UX68_9SOLA|nr:hypothetical protein RND71_033101 [Anisodus tanguticus]